MERCPKRLKTCEDAIDDSNTPVSLPPEVFAAVMNYLDYDSVLSCAATSKMLLHDAMPRVTILHIDSASQLNTLASRFRDVKEINIYSLLKHDVTMNGKIYMTIDRATVMRVLPFLSHFTNMERVNFGGRLPNGNRVEFNEAYIDDEEEDNEVGGMLIDMLSAAYHCGSIPQGLRVTGLRCVHAYNYTNIVHQFHLVKYVKEQFRVSLLTRLSTLRMKARLHWKAESFVPKGLTCLMSA